MLLVIGTLVIHFCFPGSLPQLHPYPGPDRRLDRPSLRTLDQSGVKADAGSGICFGSIWSYSFLEKNPHCASHGRLMYICQVGLAHFVWIPKKNEKLKVICKKIELHVSYTPWLGCCRCLALAELCQCTTVLNCCKIWQICILGTVLDDIQSSVNWHLESFMGVLRSLMRIRSL